MEFETILVQSPLLTRAEINLPSSTAPKICATTKITHACRNAMRATTQLTETPRRVQSRLTKPRNGMSLRGAVFPGTCVPARASVRRGNPQSAVEIASQKPPAMTGATDFAAPYWPTLALTHRHIPTPTPTTSSAKLPPTKTHLLIVRTVARLSTTGVALGYLSITIDVARFSR